jgi:vacuolar protein 8
MGNACSCCSDCFGSKFYKKKRWRKQGCKQLSLERNRTGLYEPLLQENEREAIAELLQYLESKSSRKRKKKHHTFLKYVYL